ncbi:MAG: hypothetical protein ABI852_03325 [Gemmatimonadaceae bacterium]
MAMQDNGVSDNSSSDQSNTSGDKDPGTPQPNNELPRWATKRSATTPFSDERMAAYIGPRWESTYRAKLARFFVDPAFTPTWNWAAALGSPFWFWYRKLYAAGILFAFLPNLFFGLVVTNTDSSVLQNPESPEAMQYVMMLAAVGVSSCIAAGGTANWFLFRRARAASMVVTLQQVPEDVALSRLQRIGGVSLRPVVLFLIFSALFSMVAASAGSK